MKKLLAISLLTTISGIAAAQAPHHPNGAERAAHRMQKLDKNADDAVTRDELLAHATERFERADADKDGNLTPEERKAARRAWAEQRFGKADANQDGVLSAQEIPARFAKKAAKLDANHDGNLSKDELAVLEAKFDQRAARHGAGDGVKTKTDLEAKVSARFAKLDANQDGKLTVDELARGHHGRHGMRARREG